MPTVSGYFNTAFTLSITGESTYWSPDPTYICGPPDGNGVSVYGGHPTSEGLGIDNWSGFVLSGNPVKIELRLYGRIYNSGLSNHLNIQAYLNGAVEAGSGGVPDSIFLVYPASPNWTSWFDVTNAFSALPTLTEINSGNIGFQLSYAAASGNLSNIIDLDSAEMRVTYAIPNYTFADDIRTEFFDAPDFLLSPKVKLQNRKKFKPFYYPATLKSSSLNSQSFSHATISITKGLFAKEISQSKVEPRIFIARALTANPYTQSESVRGNFYFADSPVALKGSAISQSFASASLPINNPVTVQQLTGSATSQSFSGNEFVNYIYLTSKSLEQSFAPEAGKARTVTLQSKVFCSSHAAENLDSPYKKLVALTSEVYCNSVNNTTNISITKPLSSLAESQSISNSGETISRHLSSISNEYSSSYSYKSILQKLSSQELSYSYASSHEQIKIGLTSKVISSSISEYADYNVTRPLSSNAECINYSDGSSNISKKLSAQLVSQSICEYTDTNIQRHLSANNNSQTYLIPNWSIDKKLNSEVYAQSDSKAYCGIIIGLSSKVVSQSISEYADLTATRLLNSEAITTSEAITSAISISKKISSEAVSQTKETAASISILRPFTSEVYTTSEASAQTTFNKHLASEAVSQTSALGTTHCLVNITSKVIAQSINEYADFITTKKLSSSALESSYNKSVTSLAKKLTSLAYSQSYSDSNSTVSRLLSGTAICSSFNSSAIKFTRLLVGLSLEQTNSAASIYLTKIFKAYSICIDSSFASGNLQITKKLASNTVDISSSYADTLSKILNFTSEVISQSINEYSDYHLQQALSSKSIEVSASRATETYLGTDNIVTDSLRKVNMNMQVSTDYNYRNND